MATLLSFGGLASGDRIATGGGRLLSGRKEAVSKTPHLLVIAPWTP